MAEIIYKLDPNSVVTVCTIEQVQNMSDEQFKELMEQYQDAMMRLHQMGRFALKVRSWAKNHQSQAGQRDTNVTTSEHPQSTTLGKLLAERIKQQRSNNQSN